MEPSAEVRYSFTSGPVVEGGDGFDWPASPPGMLDDTPSSTFRTPDGVVIFHDIGNSLFFDASYLLPDDATSGNGIVDEALWGNPRRADDGIVEAVIIQFDPVAHHVEFDFSWAVGASVLYVAVSDEPGGEIVEVPLPNSFASGPVYPGTGCSGRLVFTPQLARDLYDVDISSIYQISVFVDDISTDSGTSAFAIDNMLVRRAPAG